MTNEPSKPYDFQRTPPPDYLDGTMTRSELVTALEDIRFPPHGGTKPIELDADVRDYLLTLLRRA
jgi:hypothetical protein